MFILSQNNAFKGFSVLQKIPGLLMLHKYLFYQYQELCLLIDLSTLSKNLNIIPVALTTKNSNTCQKALWMISKGVPQTLTHMA